MKTTYHRVNEKTGRNESVSRVDFFRVRNGYKERRLYLKRAKKPHKRRDARALLHYCQMETKRVMKRSLYNDSKPYHKPYVDEYGWESWKDYEEANT